MLNKQKALYAAIGGALASLSSGAQAVIQGNGGLGSYLNFPYYTVKDGNDTLMSVVNSTGSAKVVKVRFFDAKNTREVLDFNLFLSPFDVWAAAITKTADGGAAIKTPDQSCTVPAIPSAGVAFRNALLNEIDWNGNTIDDSIGRTAEGYMEVIEMATLDAAAAANLARTNATGSINAAGAATHVSGVPRDCGALTQLYTNAFTTSALAPVHMLPPGGGLFGGASIINVAKGTDVTYDANAYNATYANQVHSAPASTAPNVGTVDPSACIISNQGDVFCGVFPGSGNAMSAVMMRSSASAEWVTDAGINAGTDIVFNFPTKNLYVPSGAICVTATSSTNPPGTSPFTTNFCRPAPGGAPESVAISAYDREERTSVALLDFSPSTTPGNPTLPYEAQVVTIANSNVLGSTQARNVVPPTGTSGWIKFDFTSVAGHTLSSLPGATRNGATCGAITLRGLPVTGFSVQKYANGNVGNVLSNYGGNFALKTDISVVCQ